MLLTQLGSKNLKKLRSLHVSDVLCRWLVPGLSLQTVGGVQRHGSDHAGSADGPGIHVLDQGRECQPGRGTAAKRLIF